MRFPLMGALLSAYAYSSHGSIRAGRTPQELLYQLLLLEPSVLTFQTLLLLLVFGERSHQTAASDKQTAPFMQSGCPLCVYGSG
jgi:hypothetical protein